MWKTMNISQGVKNIGKCAEPVSFLRLYCDRQNKMAVFCGEEEITVSQSEYQLLEFLMLNKAPALSFLFPT